MHLLMLDRARRMAISGAMLLLSLAMATNLNAEAAPAPLLSLERSDIVGGGSVGVSLWFTGSNAHSVEQIEVTFIGPAFLALRDPSDPAATSPLGPFKGAGPIALELATTGPVTEGKANLTFGIRYQASGAASVHAVVEKTVDIGILGVGSVAGVPLQFAAYLLPGLIAVMVARVFQIGWAKQLQALELAALGVMFSLPLLALAELLLTWPIVASWALTPVNLGGLGLLGLALGLILATPRLAGPIGRLSQMRTSANLVAAGDSTPVIVDKAFRQGNRAVAEKAVVVRTKSGDSYAGSVAAGMDNGDLMLIGWERLGGQVDKQVQELAQARKWAPLAARLRKLNGTHQLPLTTENTVRKEVDGSWVGDWDGAASRRQLAAADVHKVELVSFSDLSLAGDWFPIVIK